MVKQTKRTNIGKYMRMSLENYYHDPWKGFEEMTKQCSIDEQTNKIGKVYLVNGDTGEKIEIGNAKNLNANHLADYCSKGEKREDGSNS